MSMTLINMITNLTTAVGFIACAALTLYLLMERSSLNATSRRLVSKGAVMSALGALFFFGILQANMGITSIYTLAGTTTPLAMGMQMPSMLAAAIFAVAIPVAIQTIANLASYSEEANRTSARAIAAAVVMVTSSFIAANLSATAASATMTTVFAAIAVVSYAYILMQMYTTLPQQMDNTSETFQNAFTACRNYFAGATAAFLVVTALAQLNVMEAATGLGALITTVACLALFAAISMATFTAGRAATRAGINTAANDVDLTVSGIATTPAKKKAKAA